MDDEQIEYIPRTLVDTKNNNQVIQDIELVAKAGFVLILAEPGAGKTELLRWLATRL